MAGKKPVQPLQKPCDM